MRKLFALLFVAGMFTLVSCGEHKPEAGADSTAVVDTTAKAPEATMDTTAAVADTAAAADTAKTEMKSEEKK